MDALIATFTSPGPELFQHGPFALRWYGLLIAIAVLIGLNLSSQLARQRSLEQGLISDLLPILILAALIGARIYYVAFESRIYSNDWWGILAIWNGGIAIHGALIAGTIAVVLFCRWRYQSFWDVLDVLVPSVALGQAIGRWGNFFNSEAFGVPTDLPWKLKIPYALQSPEVKSAFPSQEFFHPTFLYESLWNLVVFSLLIVLFYRGSKGLMKLPSGALSCIYLIAYSFGRFWIEGLRTDPLCLGALPPACEGGVRIAQLMSMAMLAIGVIGLWWLYGRKKKLPDPGRPRSLTT
jgi:phosphatidylglycerol:prolipoprotein diacylglycerol transferase